MEFDANRRLFVGLATLDIILGVDLFPSGNEKVVATREAIVAGGPAANAAVTSAFLGKTSVLVSGIGQSSLGTQILSELTGRGVSVVDMDADRSESPPVAAIVVTLSTGDRAVISPGAVASQVRAGRDLSALVAASGAVLIDGHHPQLATEAVRIARESGVHSILDGGSWKPQTDALLQYIDFAICSDDFQPPKYRKEYVLEYLIKRGVKYAAVTRGARSILWASGSKRGEVPVPTWDVVDTLGAGDVFHGAFVSEIPHGPVSTEAFVSALAFAGSIASKSCGSFGTRAWMDQ